MAEKVGRATFARCRRTVPRQVCCSSRVEVAAKQAGRGTKMVTCYNNMTRRDLEDILLHTPLDWIGFEFILNLNKKK